MDYYEILRILSILSLKFTQTRTLFVSDECELDGASFTLASTYLKRSAYCVSL